MYLKSKWIKTKYKCQQIKLLKENTGISSRPCPRPESLTHHSGARWSATLPSPSTCGAPLTNHWCKSELLCVSSGWAPIPGHVAGTPESLGCTRALLSPHSSKSPSQAPAPQALDLTAACTLLFWEAIVGGAGEEGGCVSNHFLKMLLGKLLSSAGQGNEVSLCTGPAGSSRLIRMCTNKGVRARFTLFSPHAAPACCAGLMRTGNGRWGGCWFAGV